MANGDLSGPDIDEVSSHLGKLGLCRGLIIKGVFPDQFPTKHLSFCRFAHIDVDTYESMKDAFLWLWPRMVSGGIMVLDDYGVIDCPGITTYVTEIMGQPDARWFLHGGGQAVAVKI